MSQRTLVDNVLHDFWFPTAAGRIGGLAPPDKVDSTSTLSRPESVQHWPVSSRKVEARRTDRWLLDIVLVALGWSRHLLRKSTFKTMLLIQYVLHLVTCLMLGPNADVIGVDEFAGLCCWKIINIQVHLNKLECRGKVHLLQ